MHRVHKILLRAGLALGTLAMAGSAQASNFVDLEPNNTIATAQHLIHDGSINLTGFAAPGLTGSGSNVSVVHDWFRFEAVAGDVLTVLANGTGGGDPVLHLWTSAGLFLAMDDDSGLGGNSRLVFNVLASGSYVAGVGDFNDNSDLSYELIVTGLTPSLTAAVPEPATWAMMIIGFGAVGGAMRRRKANTVLA